MFLSFENDAAFFKKEIKQNEAFCNMAFYCRDGIYWDGPIANLPSLYIPLHGRRGDVYYSVLCSRFFILRKYRGLPN